ncbi:MAG: hypothetical protein H7246_15570 [Phycisphaerae bacterium]|nr:hypothetical protein [Saprospiraceae bacterium]
MKNFTTLLFALVTTSLFVACGEKGDETESLKKEALKQYAKVVLTSYEDSYNTALVLKQAIDAFVANPTDAGFQACKDAWFACRVPYNQTDAFRFYGGPIDDADGPEGLLNAWPLDESFVDYVQGNATGGYINAVGQPISKQALIAQNEVAGETAIFTGYHAIEFLLWGQDQSTSGPGARPYTDYVTGGGGTAANQDRRGQFLKAAADLLLDNLTQLLDEWHPDAAYPQEFLNSNTANASMGLVFTGLKEFTKAELAGERMEVAVQTKDQEDEHSCFSDNTTNDLKMNFLGVKNSYFGTYKKVDGTTISGSSFNDLAEEIDPAKAEAVRAAFLDAEAKLNAIPAPFDQTIVNNPAPVNAAVDALNTLSDLLVEIGHAVGAEF